MRADNPNVLKLIYKVCAKLPKENYVFRYTGSIHKITRYVYSPYQQFFLLSKMGVHHGTLTHQYLMLMILDGILGVCDRDYNQVPVQKGIIPIKDLYKSNHLFDYFHYTKENFDALLNFVVEVCAAGVVDFHLPILLTDGNDLYPYAANALDSCTRDEFLSRYSQFKHFLRVNDMSNPYANRRYDGGIYNA